ADVLRPAHVHQQIVAHTQAPLHSLAVLAKGQRTPLSSIWPPLTVTHKRPVTERPNGEDHHPIGMLRFAEREPCTMQVTHCPGAAVGRCRPLSHRHFHRHVPIGLPTIGLPSALCYHVGCLLKAVAGIRCTRGMDRPEPIILGEGVREQWCLSMKARNQTTILPRLEALQAQSAATNDQGAYNRPEGEDLPPPRRFSRW